MTTLRCRVRSQPLLDNTLHSENRAKRLLVHACRVASRRVASRLARRRCVRCYGRRYDGFPSKKRRSFIRSSTASDLFFPNWKRIRARRSYGSNACCEHNTPKARRLQGGLFFIQKSGFFPVFFPVVGRYFWRRISTLRFPNHILRFFKFQTVSTLASNEISGVSNRLDRSNWP